MRLSSSPKACLLALLLALPALPALAQMPVVVPRPADTAPRSDPERDAAQRLIEAERQVIEGKLPFDPDPWEGWNRGVHRFNKAVDRVAIRPVAKAYDKITPRPVKKGVRNFFTNIFQPLTSVHLLLQGHPKESGQAIGRFLLNATVGIGGLFDPATKAKIPMYDEDLGQTMAVWGWRRSRYLEVPFFGPRTVRDFFGGIGDGFASPYQLVEDDRARYALIGLSLVDLRTQLFAVDQFSIGIEDDYILTREGWLQRRNYMINDRENKLPGRVIRHIPGLRDRFGTAPQRRDPSLPEYLDEPLPDEEGFQGPPLPEYLNEPLPDEPDSEQPQR